MLRCLAGSRPPPHRCTSAPCWTTSLRTKGPRRLAEDTQRKGCPSTSSRGLPLPIPAGHWTHVALRFQLQAPCLVPTMPSPVLPSPAHLQWRKVELRPKPPIPCRTLTYAARQYNLMQQAFRNVKEKSKMRRPSNPEILETT